MIFSSSEIGQVRWCGLFVTALPDIFQTLFFDVSKIVTSNDDLEPDFTISAFRALCRFVTLICLTLNFIVMPSKAKKNELPKPKSGDVLEALEMVRATMTLLRQSFGIAFMAGSIGAKVFFDDDTALKEWCVQFRCRY